MNSVSARSKHTDFFRFLRVLIQVMIAFPVRSLGLDTVGLVFAQKVGAVLRAARRRRGLTLRELEQLSRGRFKATSVAGYERGERTISLERFFELARLYTMSPQRLLAEIERATEERPPVILDFRRVNGLGGREAALLADFASEVRAMRGEWDPDMITLRAGDVEVLATLSGSRADDFLERIKPALVEGR